MADRPEIELCEADRVRGYRGGMQLVERSDGASALLNRVRVESYLRGVAPRESPASWADLGGGRAPWSAPSSPPPPAAGP